MATVWHGVVNPPRPGQLREWRYDGPQAPSLTQGDEMGRFLLGSTVVLLFPGSLTFDAAWRPGGAVRMGESMAAYPNSPGAAVASPASL
jgi:phosphatidylserine decarboxylase